MHQPRVPFIFIALALSSGALALTACLNFGECTVDEDCGGDVCSNGQCVQCEADSDCDEGETCEDNQCEEQGGGGGNVTGGCDGDEDCAEGQTCDVEQGTCSDPPIGQTFLCCFARDGVPQAYECPDASAQAACNDGGFDACAQNAERDGECSEGVP